MPLLACPLSLGPLAKLKPPSRHQLLDIFLLRLPLQAEMALLMMTAPSVAPLVRRTPPANLHGRPGGMSALEWARLAATPLMMVTTRAMAAMAI